MMTMDRRTFMGTMAAGWLALRNVGAASIQRLGVQLYTVRDDLGRDFEGTLAKIAGLGFKEVEFAGYFNRTPQQVRDVLAKSGLTSPSAHVDYASLTKDWDKVLNTAKTIGHQYVIVAWLDESLRKEPDIWKKTAERFNRAGAAAKAAGLEFAYHNHNFEFAPADGKLPYDMLLETCDPKLVKMEMDLCWITAAGKDPLDYFRRYPGRFPLVHVKGLSKKPDLTNGMAPIDTVLPTITDVGTNDIVDWPRIFAHAKEAGIEHYFIEHDVPKAPFESLKRSYDYVSGLKF
jgi:sugar phosphate isomerase/epimerase